MQIRLPVSRARPFATWLLGVGMVLAADPARPMPPAHQDLDAVVKAALADAAQRSGLPATALRVDSAQAVTWRDGSLYCRFTRPAEE